MGRKEEKIKLASEVVVSTETARWCNIIHDFQKLWDRVDSELSARYGEECNLEAFDIKAYDAASEFCTFLTDFLSDTIIDGVLSRQKNGSCVL